MRNIHGYFLGDADYGTVHELQSTLFEARKAKRGTDTLLFVEHPAVITLGRGAKAENILASEAALKAAGVRVESTGRGGDVTLHAPGQLVCYPILDLAPDRCDVRRYVRDLTRVMQRLAAKWGLDARPWDKYIGLWVDQASPSAWLNDSPKDPAKIGAIGVRISHWVTMHGFALNLTTNLALFNLIVPCGIREHPVTSVKALTSQEPSVRDAARAALSIAAEVFEADVGELEDKSAALIASDAA